MFDYRTIKSYVRTVPDFPKEGIQFRDISGLIENPEAFNQVVLDLTTISQTFGATKMVGIDSRGFVFGAPLARDLDIPFIMARKPGKLPGKVHSKEYELEYGTASLEIQAIADIKSSDIVVIVDDLIATGGTAIACADIVHEQFDVAKNNILVLAVIDLPDLGGFNKIAEQGYRASALIEFEGE
mgnify:CR=1 FL=1|jgi:adenine phosphoribosyltransferase|tara:strand:- start:109 stop:660 length:552 start_codon:yes stop_codon:yes gene_type:complete